MFRLIPIIAIAGVLSSVPAFAQDRQLQPYIEGQISRVFIDDVDANTTTQVGGFNAAVDLTGEYEDATALGAEIGIAGIGGSGLRMGLGYTTFDAELEAIDVSAAISFGGVALATVADRVTADQLRNAGADIGEKVKAYSINAYYDVDMSTAIRPYIGLGVGLADIENMEDKEVMLSGYVGANYSFTENFYAGLRASIHHIEGPEDEAGILYDDIRTYALGLVVGVKF